jgi:hypothetical protein
MLFHKVTHVYHPVLGLLAAARFLDALAGDEGQAEVYDQV